MAGVFLIGGWWVQPLRDVPIIDDWTYAWSVEHLLKTGELRIAEISSVYPVAQILWGTLFAQVFGFSFGVLRISTAVLAFLGCVAFYFTLIELGCSRLWSTVGAVAVAVHPVYFSLAFSYMTDVPVTALSMAALLFAVQAARRDDPSRLWLAGACSLAAFLVRATAVVTPLAMLAAVPWRRQRLVAWATPLAATFAAMVIAWMLMHRAFGSLEVETGRLERLRWIALITAREYADWNTRMLWQTAIAFAPLLLAGITARGRWRWMALATAIVGLATWAAVGRLPLPMPDWSTWSLQDLGGGRVLIGGAAPTSAWSARAAPEVIAVGLVSAAAMGMAIVAMLVPITRDRAVVLVPLAAAIAVTNALWLYNDRYYLILLPPLATIAGWWAARASARGWIVAVPVLVLFFAIDLTGTRDMLDVNEVATAAVRDLEASGVPPWEIDGGWALNGWRLWAHPEHLKPGTDRQYGVPFVTSNEQTPYLIASMPMRGYDVVRVLPLPHVTWQSTDRVYVLRQTR